MSTTRFSIPVLPAWARWALVGVVVAVLAWGSLSPSRLVTRASEGFPYGDEGLHVASYAVLALAFTYAWLPERPRPLRRGLVVFAGVLAFGLLMEVLQSQVPQRTPDVGDAAANAIGAATALVWDALVARLVAHAPTDAPGP